MSEESFLALSVREFERLKGLAERAMAQVSDPDFFTVLGDGDNSIATIVMHMAGNLRSRWTDFLTTDGEKLDRNRDTEFEVIVADTRATLHESWELGWHRLFAALDPLNDRDLARVVTIRGESLTVLQAISRQLTHYAYHTGQIVLLSKHFAGDHWQTLSVAKGQSVAFNARPTSYLDDEST